MATGAGMRMWPTNLKLLQVPAAATFFRFGPALRVAVPSGSLEHNRVGSRMAANRRSDVLGSFGVPEHRTENRAAEFQRLREREAESLAPGRLALQPAY
jgi:hypothetical protein